MRVIITGASSGIGLEIAKIYYNRGCRLILVARNVDKISKMFPKAKTISMDLSVRENCFKLYEMTGGCDILINNAGYGDWGYFNETSLETELNMISLNVEAVHILTKLYLKNMVKNNRGSILNVASLAAFSYGPLMSSYYAAKAYVYKLSVSVDYELKKMGSNVRVLALCPGPVETGFNDRAGVKFSVKPLKSEYVARRAVNAVDKGKRVVLPGLSNKMAALASRFVPVELLLRIGYWIQKNK